MKPLRQLRLRRNLYIVLGSVLSAGCCPGGCCSSVYPASECKSPPPPLTVPESPRSQCREVATEHASEWPQKYKDIQYSEENTVYWMRVAFTELEPATQKQLKDDFARALAEINSADGKYLQLIDAAVASKGEYTEATKMLRESLGEFMKFFDEHLKGPTITSGAQKNIDKAKASYQQLLSQIEPPPAAASEEGEPSTPAADKEKEEEEEPQSEMMKKE